MSHLPAEFGLLAGAHLLAVASPGPDFALVMRQSLVKGRGAALRSSLGIGSGILVHVAYSLLGIGFLIQSSPLAFACVKWAGAAYLCWIAWQCLRPRAASVPAASPATEPLGHEKLDTRGAWLSGFLTNVLNPKATLFFLALFSAGINPLTPRWVVACYGLWMALATAAWFSLVSLIFTREGLRARFLRCGLLVDRITGVVLLLFAARLALA